ncbi:MBL fold metallo-hydrolase [Porphyromonas sp.]|uniref:MBL fold metallo-hydrolase n=1 Tax=Porphyromonas sp. TaxID=1924944 RepID=UPI0026DAE523|nr:MBL fold metallo-hydrolase [Porphyromonas sp.]MDO4695615.1 MBL fold metallo-hydrolase [Porphyromonas sp.]MDO4771561.1 MBL fold metallo-hydrolase [Porphyromonas sp.]
MIQYHSFAFNFAAEQTYIVWDETREACIIDPGCSTPQEEKILAEFIAQNKLIPVRLLCTHLHFDHCIGAGFVKDKWDIDPEASDIEIDSLPSLSDQLKAFGLGHLPVKDVCIQTFTFDEEAAIHFGKSVLRVRHVPGHSPGHVVFYEETANILFAGDTLFNLGIGRTDLWGGDYDTLITAIRSQIFTLPDTTKVLPGHGPHTTVAFEKAHNPYFSC